MKQAPLSGRYELEEIIGTGGMSVVYRAWDLKYDREVAVKVLRSELMSDEDFIRRFNHEAQAASQMSHPNIVDLFDVGQDGETRYLVMEYVKGVTLKELIRQYGRIRPQRAVQITLSILSAIGHAHENHIVHRDIKPQNILMDADSGVKVGDFGIARVTSSNSSTSFGTQMMGSVHYFSPEQASGGMADEKSDLYSVGVVLYEMVTGHVPFDGETPVAVALKHIHEEPRDPSLDNPDVSRGLSEVILKAMAKRPEDRYQSAQEMAIDLRRALKMPMGGFIRRQAEEPKPPRMTRKRALSIALAGVCAVAALTVMVAGLRYYNKLKTRVRMPALEKAQVEDATAQLDELALKYQLIQIYSEDALTGTVIAQSPASGMLLFPGDRVELTVSLGKAAVEVPALTEILRSEAMQRLEEASLALGDIVLQISDEKPGTVIGQSPAAGERVPPFSEVTLYVSGESAPAPEMKGKSREEAEQTLSACGMQPGLIEWAFDEAAPGTVIAQSAPANQRTLLGGRIDLVLSLGKAQGAVCKKTVRVSVEGEMGELICLLDEGTENSREVYHEWVPRGEWDVRLEMADKTQGEHRLSVYLDGQSVLDETVVFE